MLWAMTEITARLSDRCRTKGRIISLALTLLMFFGSGSVTASAVQEDDEAALLRAVSEGSITEVRRLLDKGVDPEARSYGGVTALMAAAQRGHTAVVSLLLDHGAHVNARDAGGDTPLGYFAALHGQVGVAKLLLEYGADVNATNTRGWSAGAIGANPYIGCPSGSQWQMVPLRS